MSSTPEDIASRFRQEFCPKCDYSLEGLGDAAVCPECGFHVDPEFLVLRGKPTGAEKSLFRGSTSEFVFMSVLIVGAAWYMFQSIGGAPIAFGIIVALTILALLYRIWNPETDKALLWFHESGIAQSAIHDGFWKNPVVRAVLPLLAMVFPLSMTRWDSISLIIVTVIVVLVVIAPNLVDQLRARAACIPQTRSDVPPIYPWLLFKFVQFKFVAENRWQVRAVMASRLAAPALVSIEVSERDEVMVALRERVHRLAPNLDIRG